ncbi:MULTISPECIES: HD domain-containing protein [unclassified Achromobacter]|uniref:HD domain-containing protein n=1 Tax=unclassified Achromobacter TaxID=2626865 RepID=UPI000B51D1F6|nr:MULTISPECIES: HD domain-containing protein [unclassified Achromobacter]OWT70177.1 phosphohydrolase [Achromobacter sp. HZ34]OWT71717.1 phosphohydrolase [Achromobacter sp. HZ28]
MGLTLDQIANLFHLTGGSPYGDTSVTQAEHARQTAALALAEAAAPSLVTAALLHDLGHLILQHPDIMRIEGADYKHQYFVQPFLRGLFGADVLEPIRLHVEAHRYLCFVEPDYLGPRNSAARLALDQAGGIFDAAQASEFSAIPWAPEAIRLRRWDDQACLISDDPPPPLSYFLEIASDVAQRHQATQLPRLGTLPHASPGQSAAHRSAAQQSTPHQSATNHLAARQRAVPHAATVSPWPAAVKHR